MQSVIAIPEIDSSTGHQSQAELLVRPVAGVPLLKRTILTAIRAGATDILLISSDAEGEVLARKIAYQIASFQVRFRFIQARNFDPRDSLSWAKLPKHMDHPFLWIPWNWVTTKRFLTNLPIQAGPSANWAEPAHTFVGPGDSGTDSSTLRPEGVPITSLQDLVRAERFLVAHSGKILDGIHTSFNRRLCRPLVRALSHTPITPDVVTFGGVIVSLLSAIEFAHGGYAHSVLGAVMFYLAGLFDEMDGMLARIKFAESPRGTWLEGIADGLSYVLLFAGITIGMIHQYGQPAKVMGTLLLVGTILALVVTSLQRRLATAADRPNEYRDRMYELLDRDSGNWISRLIRRVEGLIRRGILICYVLILTVLGGLPLIFMLATIGAHVTWILTLYLNRRFFRKSFHMVPRSPANTIKETL